ncbi:putative integral membrane domain protein, partial [Vibrio parahaemolyticus V-223/04]
TIASKSKPNSTKASKHKFSWRRLLSKKIH